MASSTPILLSNMSHIMKSENLHNGCTYLDSKDEAAVRYFGLCAGRVCTGLLLFTWKLVTKFSTKSANKWGGMRPQSQATRALPLCAASTQSRPGAHKGGAGTHELGGAGPQAYWQNQQARTGKKKKLGPRKFVIINVFQQNYILSCIIKKAVKLKADAKSIFFRPQTMSTI